MRRSVTSSGESNVAYAWLLEQDDDGRDLCCECLGAWGLEVYAFRRADELVMASGAPLVAVIDAWTSAAREDVARALPPERTVVMTTHPMQAAFWQERGFPHVLLKPLDFDRFEDIVRSIASPSRDQRVCATGGGPGCADR